MAFYGISGDGTSPFGSGKSTQVTLFYNSGIFARDNERFSLACVPPHTPPPARHTISVIN
jgi:hypothetical protein